jgi:hypothetical protein
VRRRADRRLGNLTKSSGEDPSFEHGRVKSICFAAAARHADRVSECAVEAGDFAFLPVGHYNSNAMSKVEQMEAELRKLSQMELRQIREWLDDIIEDELEFTPEFERAIQQSERDMVDGQSSRVREPEGS